MRSRSAIGYDDNQRSHHLMIANTRDARQSASGRSRKDNPPMPTRIDHVIIGAPVLDALEQSFIAMGFSVTGGGSHPHLGTRNRIIILGEGYIELLAVADPAIASPALCERVARGAVWVGFALQSGDIAEEVAAARTRSVDVRGPAPGRLVAPDRMTRSWRVATFGTNDLWSAALPLPFLIQHDSVGEQHQRELAGAGGHLPHRNGATRLNGVTIMTSDLAQLRQSYEHAYDLTAARSDAVEALYPLGQSGEWISLRQLPASATWSAAATRMRVTVGAPELALIHSLGSQSHLPVEAGADAVTITLPGSDATVTFSAPVTEG